MASHLGVLLGDSELLGTGNWEPRDAIGHVRGRGWEEACAIYGILRKLAGDA